METLSLGGFLSYFFLFIYVFFLFAFVVMLNLLFCFVMIVCCSTSRLPDTLNEDTSEERRTHLISMKNKDKLLCLNYYPFMILLSLIHI